jgi:hypothetical protein
LQIKNEAQLKNKFEDARTPPNRKTEQALNKTVPGIERWSFVQGNITAFVDEPCYG